MIDGWYAFMTAVAARAAMGLAAQAIAKPDTAVAVMGWIGTFLMYMSAATLAVAGANVTVVIALALGVSMAVHLVGKPLWGAIPGIANRVAPWALTICVAASALMGVLVVPGFLSLLEG